MVICSAKTKVLVVYMGSRLKRNAAKYHIVCDIFQIVNGKDSRGYDVKKWMRVVIVIVGDLVIFGLSVRIETPHFANFIDTVFTIKCYSIWS